MHTRLFVTLLFLTTAISCTKDPIIGDRFVYLKYAQTQCADRWQTGTTDSITLVNARHYLDSAGLFAMDMNIRPDGVMQVCLACTCTTGKTIYVSTLEGSDAAFIPYGFNRVN